MTVWILFIYTLGVILFKDGEAPTGLALLWPILVVLFVPYYIKEKFNNEKE